MSLEPAGIVNGATLRPRLVAVQTTFGMFAIPITRYDPVNENPAPGEVIAIRGQCLGPLRFSEATVDAGGRLPTTLAGIEVLINGVPAPLLSAGPNQLNAVVPYEVAASATADLEVRYRGATVGARLETAVASVGIFPVPSFSGAATQRLC
jgi:uncharacterized protein (TIGR03437 family)